MSLDKETVARIARLARLKVPEDELAPLAGELSGILAWIEQLNEVDTANVEPLSSVSDVTLPMRADKVTDGGIAAKNVAPRHRARSRDRLSVADLRAAGGGAALRAQRG